MKKIISSKPGLKVKRAANPKINLQFVTDPIEVSDEVAKKLLENPNFKEVDGKKSKKKVK
jgi:hypothetical protein